MPGARLFVCAVFLLAAFAPALAGEKASEARRAEERIKALEKKVAELQKRLDAVEKSAKAAPPLKDSRVSLQSLIDKAKDGEVIKVPRARYVSKKGIKIKKRSTLTLACEKGTQILCEDTDENVIAITASSNIRIENAYLRHKKPLTGYQCHGSVVHLKDCSKITIVESELNGCGAVGLYAQDSKGISVRKCLIQRNSFCAFYLESCARVKILDNIIEKNGQLMNLHKVDGLEMDNNIVRRNCGYMGRVAEEPGPSK